MVDVAALRALCDAASPGPWLVTRQYLAVETAQLDNRGEPYGHELWAVVASEDNDDADVRAEFERSAPFIAASRLALPACLDEIERLRAEVATPGAVTHEPRHSPRFDSDPLELALAWNGHSGTREPDFDLIPEDTASILAAAVIASHARIDALYAEVATFNRDENLAPGASLPKALNVIADQAATIAQLRAALTEALDHWYDPFAGDAARIDELRRLAAVPT